MIKKVESLYIYNLQAKSEAQFGQDGYLMRDIKFSDKQIHKPIHLPGAPKDGLTTSIQFDGTEISYLKQEQSVGDKYQSVEMNVFDSGAIAYQQMYGEKNGDKYDYK